MAIGDIHLGNRPASVPDALRRRIGDEIDPAEVWKRAVEKAIQYEVSAVLLVGDVVHELHDAWRVERDVERGVRQLAEHGIRVISVVGNHDIKALPAIAESIPSLQLIGTDDAWEQCVVEDADGSPIAQIIGWSFPRCPYTSSPLKKMATFHPETLQHVPTIGLLHCDLDQTQTDYAPVARRELEQVSFVDAWLLGHVHTASFDQLNEERPIGYLGCLTPLRSKDQREHGPWLITIEDRRISMEILPIAPLRFDRLDVDVSGLDSADMIQPTIAAAMKQHVIGLGTARESLRALGFIVNLTGSSPIARAIKEKVDSEEDEIRGYERQEGEIACFVHRIESEVRLSVDLATITSGSAAGMLVNELQVLERGLADSQCKQIIDEARQEIRRATAHRSFRADDLVSEVDDSDEAILEQLITAGREAVDVLIATRGDMRVD